MGSSLGVTAPREDGDGGGTLFGACDDLRTAAAAGAANDAVKPADSKSRCRSDWRHRLLETP